MSRNIDGGYAWVILAACAGIQIVSDGITKSLGLFYVEMLEQYEEQNVITTTLISGIMNAVFCVSTVPGMMFLLKRMEPRYVVIVGCIISSIGYSLSGLAKNLHFLFFTMSFLVGGGLALIYPPSIYILGTYFSQKRALANGLAISGSSLGGLAFPILFRYLLDSYGIQGAFILAGGVMLHNLIFASLLRPNKRQFLREYDVQEEKQEHTQINIHKMANTPVKRACEFSADSERLTTEGDPFLTSPCTDQEKASDSNELRKSLVSKKEDDAVINSEESRVSLKTVTPGPCTPLQNPTFVLFIFANSLASVVGVTFISFLPLYAKQNRVSNSDIVILVSVAAAFDFIGRILSGVLADRPQIKTSHILAVSQGACGIAHICNQLFTSFPGFLVFSIAVGLFSGIQLPLMFTHATEILGLELSSSGFSILIVGQLPVFILGPFFFGLLRDVTGDYAASYYFVGSNALAATTLFLLEPLTNRYMNKN